jgi:uncharacterized protein YutE (UPF0331/DUF86 family)
MQTEFSGIEKRLDELNERLARLDSLSEKEREDYDSNPFLRDIAERNLDICIRCCIDICHRIIALENGRKPIDYYEAFLVMSELGVLSPDFSRRLAPLAGFRNILTHEYLGIDWDVVYNNLQDLDDLVEFSKEIQGWLLHKTLQFKDQNGKE